MARGLSYADAMRVLGGREDRTVAALDRLAGGLLLVASAAGAGFALSLFDPKSELARLSGDLVSGLAERLRGVSRLGRSERLAAAHAVVVLTAYFEALREASLPFDVKELKLTGSEQFAVATGGAAGSNVMALLKTWPPTGVSDTPRWRQFVRFGALRPVTMVRLLSVRRWSERTVILLVMQTLDNSLITYRRRGRLMSRRGHGEPNPAAQRLGRS